MKKSILYFLPCLFLIACKENSSKQILDTGYEYKVYTNQAGTIPQVGDVVTMDLEVINDKGIVIDDSREAPEKPVFEIPEVGDPKTKGNAILSLLRVLKPGDSASVYVPLDSLPQHPQSFEGSAFIEYKLKVHYIEERHTFLDRRNAEKEAKMRTEEKKARDAFAAYEKGELDGNIYEVDNTGIRVALINDTKGPKPTPGMGVSVDYFGFLKSGESFDNSVERGRPYNFILGRRAVIDGWDLGIPHIPEGSSAIIDVPYEKAYGVEGRPPSIPAYSDLVFYVKLNKIYSQAQQK